MRLTLGPPANANAASARPDSPSSSGCTFAQYLHQVAQSNAQHDEDIKEYTKLFSLLEPSLTLLKLHYLASSRATQTSSSFSTAYPALPTSPSSHSNSDYHHIWRQSSSHQASETPSAVPPRSGRAHLSFPPPRSSA